MRFSGCNFNEFYRQRQTIRIHFGALDLDKNRSRLHVNKCNNTISPAISFPHVFEIESQIYNSKLGICIGTTSDDAYYTSITSRMQNEQLNNFDCLTHTYTYPQPHSRARVSVCVLENSELSGGCRLTSGDGASGLFSVCKIHEM